MAASTHRGMRMQHISLPDSSLASLESLERVHSPAPASELWAEAAGVGASSPEVHTECPQPRRAFAPEYPASPNSPWPTGDESRELQELLGNCAKIDGLSRPLSSVSTAYNPFDSRPVSSTSVVMCGAQPQSFDDNRQATENAAPRRFGDGKVSKSNNAPKPLSQELSSVEAQRPSTDLVQNRKVFVGGVPQDMKSNDLNAFFGAFGAVQKAWLQKCRTVGTRDKTGVAQNHRGFGFVIFNESSTVHKVLGGSQVFSRFIDLKDGKKLEVKRALSSTSIEAGAGETKFGGQKGGGTKSFGGGGASAPAAPVFPGEANGSGKQVAGGFPQRSAAGGKGTRLVNRPLNRSEATMQSGQAEPGWPLEGNGASPAPPVWNNASTPKEGRVPTPDYFNIMPQRPGFEARQNMWSYPVTAMCGAPQAAVAAAVPARGFGPPGNFHAGSMQCGGLVATCGVGMIMPGLVDIVPRRASTPGAEIVQQGNDTFGSSQRGNLGLQGQALESMLINAMPDHYDD